VPEATTHLAMKNRRRRFRRLSNLSSPQHHTELQVWGSAKQSTLIVIRGTSAINNFSLNLAISIIQTIILTNIPVVWALDSRNTETCSRSPEACSVDPPAKPYNA